jgi:hypothetical protein
MLTRYASVLQVRDNHGGPRTCHRSGAGREAPGKTSHYSREAILGLSYHVPHFVVRVGQAAAADSGSGRKARRLLRTEAVLVWLTSDVEVERHERGDSAPENCKHRSGMNPAFMAL